MKTGMQGTVMRANVRGWRLARTPGTATGPRGVLRQPPLSAQVHRWTLLATLAIVLTFLGAVFYLDALTGFWLGAVMGRLALGGLMLFVLGACLVGTASPTPKRPS